MEEKIIIRSERSRVKMVIKIVDILCAVVAILALVFSYNDIMYDYKSDYRAYLKHRETGSCGSYYDEVGRYCWDCQDYIDNPTKLGYFIWTLFDDPFYFFWCVPTTFLAICVCLVYLRLRRCELTVTDKRIYGRTVWGKRVEIPVNSIIKTERIRLLKGIEISTSSSDIRFPTVKNAEEIDQIISELQGNGLSNKQNSLSPTYNFENHGTVQRKKEKEAKERSGKKPKLKRSTVQQIKRYKELLDLGIITQEEFENKKKQLLDL